MAFTNNQIITASNLNTVNGASINGNGGNSTTTLNWRSYDIYFYVNADSGQPIGNLRASGGWTIAGGRAADTTLYRYENGNWVQKARKEDHAFAYNNSNAYQDVKSYGEGSYYAHCSARYCHEIAVTIYNAKRNNQTGSKLKMLKNTMNLSSSRVEFSSAQGEIITIDRLNTRQVYT